MQRTERMFSERVRGMVGQVCVSGTLLGLVVGTGLGAVQAQPRAPHARRARYHAPASADSTLSFNHLGVQLSERVGAPEVDSVGEGQQFRIVWHIVYSNPVRTINTIRVRYIVAGKTSVLLDKSDTHRLAGPEREDHLCITTDPIDVTLPDGVSERTYAIRASVGFDGGPSIERTTELTVYR